MTLPPEEKERGRQRALKNLEIIFFRFFRFFFFSFDSEKSFEKIMTRPFSKCSEGILDRLKFWRGLSENILSQVCFFGRKNPKGLWLLGLTPLPYPLFRAISD